jgi:hypothetical protein
VLATVPAAAVLLLSASFSASLDLNALVSAEARAGETPVRPGDPSTSVVMGILAPGVSASLAGPEASLRLGYVVRLVSLGPSSGLPPTAPLDFHVAVLHVLDLQASARPSRTLTLTATGAGSIGEPDYAALAGILGPTPTGTLPAVQKIFAVSGHLGARYLASPRWELALAGEAARYHSYGGSVTAGSGAGGMVPLFVAPPLPDQTVLRALPSAIAHLSRRSDLLLLGELDRVSSSGSVAVPGGAFDFVVASTELGWRTRLSRLGDLRVLGGVAHGWRSGSGGVMSPSGVSMSGMGPSWSPIGGVEIGSWLPGQDEPRLRGTFATSVDYFVDPFLGAAGPRSTTSLALGLLFQPDTTAALEAIFSTVIRSEPLVGNPDETVVAVQLPIRHRLSDTLFVEGGVRGSDRGPNFSAPSFAFHQRELWVYLRLTATTRSRPGIP